jgi:hypothetical protein
MDSDWMMPNEILSWLKENVEEGKAILEFGSGHGSIKLAEHFNLVSIEHNREWFGIATTKYVHAEIQENPISTEYNQQGWYNPQPIIDIIKSTHISVFIVDGPPGDIGRHGLLSILEEMPKDSIFIIDDVHRDEEFDLLQRLLAWHGGTGTINSSVYESGKERKWAVIQPT